MRREDKIATVALLHAVVAGVISSLAFAYWGGWK